MDTRPSQVGVIYGDVASTRFQIAVSDTGLKRLDYVQAEHDEGLILGQVETVQRHSDLTFDQAIRVGAGEGHTPRDRLSAQVHVLGRMDSRGRVQVPRTPFRSGIPVQRASESLVAEVLGLAQTQGKGAYIGHVKGLRTPVHLSLNALAQKHLSVLAKTGAGKSYTVGVILEEFLQAGVPLLVLDPHGEYGALRHPNVDPEEMAAMVRHGVRPRSFQDQVREFAVDTHLNPEAEKLRLDGVNLEAREILDLLGGKLSGGQVGVLYQAVKDVKEEMPGYTLRDIADAVGRNKSSARWNVLNALETLDATGLFHTRATPMEDLLQADQCTIVNLKGVPPDQQEIVATRLIGRLWEARKRNEAPPHILVIEEAHNFCPERGVAQAQSGAIIRTVASEGRKFGMGLVIVSQRPAKIDKNVLSQCNTQVVLKITNPNDLKAISQSVEGITAETTEELQRLPVGSALVSGGGLTQPVFVDIRPRLTRHGGRSIDLLAGDPDAEEDDAQEDAAMDDAEDWEVEDPWAPLAEEPDAEEAGGMTFAETGDEGRLLQHELGGPTSTVDAPAVVSGPDNVPGPTAEGAAPAAPPTPPRQWKREELLAVARVSARLDLVHESDPDRVRRLLQDLALRQGHGRDHYLDYYLAIATTACHDGAPLCVRCPLADRCPYHKELQAKRHKHRGAIRRLWQKR